MRTSQAAIKGTKRSRVDLTFSGHRILPRKWARRAAGEKLIPGRVYRQIHPSSELGITETLYIWNNSAHIPFRQDQHQSDQVAVDGLSKKGRFMFSRAESNFTTDSARKVMIVEDEFLIALDLEATVTELGLDVVGLARDTEQALSLAPKADIAFVDVNLADGATGPEIGQRLVDEFGVTVVFMTGNPEMVDGRVRGALGVLKKPATPSIVQRSLQQALDARRLA